MALDSLGKILIYIGVITVLIGAFFLFLSRMPWFGKLPGDIAINRSGWTIYIPLTTMILVSLILTLILNFVFRK
jgi:Zn-dependent protease with chaperone function